MIPNIIFTNGTHTYFVNSGGDDMNDELAQCTTCSGRGIIECSDCNCTGKDGLGRTCLTCRGKGVLHCTDCDGHGQQSHASNPVEPMTNDPANEENEREAIRNRSVEDFNRRQQQNRKTSRNIMIRVILIIVVFAGTFLGRHYYPDIKKWFNKSEFSFSSPSKKAIQAATTLLEKNLKSPSTAKVISSSVVEQQPPFYLVHLVVDSQNDFSAMVRTSALVSVELAEDNQYKYNMLTSVQESSNPPLDIEIQLVKQLNNWPGAIESTPEVQKQEAPSPSPSPSPSPQNKNASSDEQDVSSNVPEVNTDYLILPGQSVGRTKLGMSRSEVINNLGKPAEEDDLTLTYKSKKNYITLYFEQDEIVQIEFTSSSFRTAEGFGTDNIVPNTDGFITYEAQWRFLNYRMDSEGGGLSFATFNADVPDDNMEYERYTRAYVYEGDSMPYEPINGLDWRLSL